MWKVRVVAVPHDRVSEMADMFRLLGEPSRLRLVLACMEGARSVGELTGALALPQTLASHHLRLLRTARILRAERDGRHVRYSIDDGHVRDVLANMIAHLTEPHGHRTNPDEGMRTMANDTTTCACADCVCKVSTEKAVMKDGEAFCCEECAAGHVHHAGCEHEGCACHG